jgi:Nif-specific regulatory protein
LLGTGKDLHETLDRTLELLASEMGMRRGMITLLPGNSDEAHLDIAPAMKEGNVEEIVYGPGEGITGRVLSNGEPIVIPNLKEEPDFLDRAGLRKNKDMSKMSFICVPVRFGETVIGALSVDVEGCDGDALSGMTGFLRGVADMIAPGVEARRKEDERKRLEIENIGLKKQIELKSKPSNIIGNSRVMQSVYSLINQVADSGATVLITGETGTGKELAAAAIHKASPRRATPFVAVSCAALPETLLESELFGHEKGAFTGALERRAGKFEQAAGGTVFLDEIGEMSLSSQAKLLRVLQTKEIEMLGGDKPIRVNVRIVAATNRDLERAVTNGEFRADLFYRLNVFPIHMPPLRERGADIMLLADYFVHKYSAEFGKEVDRICSPAIDALMAYHWPGNVRELENCVERAVLMSDDGVIHSYNLPPSLRMRTREANAGNAGSLESRVEAFERDLIEEAIKYLNGNQSAAARELGTTKRVIQYKSAKYGIDCGKYKPPSK